MRSGEVAELFGVSTKTVCAWVKRGQLEPTCLTPGGQYRFARSMIMGLLVKGMARGEELDDIV